MKPTSPQSCEPPQRPVSVLSQVPCSLDKFADPARDPLRKLAVDEITIPVTRTVPPPAYRQITECTESYYDRLGDSPLGMGWPNVPDALRRFGIMLDVIRGGPSRSEPLRLLDLGCGVGHLYEYLRGSSLDGIRYTGIDLSQRFIGICRSTHPGVDFRHVDILQHPEALDEYDYTVINGVFTSKCAMSFHEMWAFVQSLLKLVFRRSRCGIAFNAMSSHVDWERDDLFHLPLDTLAAFLCRNLSRNFVFRNDYGLYEFTTYVYQSGNPESLQSNSPRQSD